jgi:uncharacterized OB-fold protein
VTTPIAGDVPDETVLERYPAIRLDRLNKHHYGGYLAHRLVLGRCTDCRRWHSPLRPRCPECWSEAVVPSPVSGRGTVHLLTLLHQGPPSADVDYSAPWPLAAIELVEQTGLRFVATIVDCPPQRLRIGLPVELTWITRAGAPWPAFRPVKEAVDGVA